MSHLTLELPEELRSKLESRAAEAGHQSLEQYVRTLLQCEADVAEVDDEDFGAPANQTLNSDDELEALLIQGEESGPATEVTKEEWKSIRQELSDRIAENRRRKNA